jgi:hypothetical protein
MIVPSQLALKTHTNFGCAVSLATLDKLVDRFPLLPVAPPISDISLTHVVGLAAHSTTSPTLAAMGESIIMTYIYLYRMSCEKLGRVYFLFVFNITTLQFLDVSQHIGEHHNLI